MQLNSPNNDNVIPVLLHYGHNNGHWLRNWQWTWLLATFFGVLQIPWCVAVAIRVGDMQSSRPMDFVRNSLLDSWELAFTIPAIIFGLLGILSCWRTRNRGGLIFCAIALAVSILILWVVGDVWYQEVYCVVGKN